MKRLRQSPWIAAMLFAVAGTSGANVRVASHNPQPVNIGPLDAQSRSAACKPFLEIPADSTSELLPWDQRLSLAGCRPLITPAPVSDPEKFHAMVIGLEQSAGPAIVIYRNAMAHAPTQIKIVAAYGLGMTYADIMVRARNAVHVADAGLYGGRTYGGATYLQRLDTLHRSLEPLLVGDRDAALLAFDEVARLADQDPAAARANEVDEFAVKDARNQADLLRL